MHSSNTNKSNAALSSDGSTVKLKFSLQDPIFRWNQPNGKGSDIALTYSYDNLLDGGIKGGITESEIKTAIEESFELWAQYAPLDFVEVEDTGRKSQTNPDAADIRFGYEEIDGSGGTLGEASLTYFGDLATEVDFDSQDRWATEWSNSTFDFLAVAVHEIGHTLGLDHESEEDAIMQPFATDIYSGLGTAFLYDDDIKGIRALYGKGKGSVDPLDNRSNTSPSPTPDLTPSDAALVLGTKANDVLLGSDRAQTLQGLRGNDQIRAGDGNDVVIGDKGNDQLLGEGGDDRLLGDDNNDLLDGGDGNDSLVGGQGKDMLIGGSGDDYLTGRKGRDTLIGVGSGEGSSGDSGVGEKDTLIGGGHGDLFVLGSQAGVFYDDGLSDTVGTDDYAFISDFRSNEGDRIQLHGSASDYSIGRAPKATKGGQGIFLNTADEAELIAVVRGNNGLMIQSEAFTFV
ncbi:matrixin family metalloprotease [cf. Phormidesmis sp. LEGE 11477]|uniref:matrixin family metalloprotease n=1 Tax=cf. Phormidesmis sp. LEGE 11477 TaxID=1828680 RepID=UPI0018810C24|nr:matrixin family metalloprotease [cf. Phormidesmis sp. LEGE 11477]MBE9061536.1 matrixin family metalloprotease [cf. Phormidesmis sp. LEGE 11477]